MLYSNRAHYPLLSVALLLVIGATVGCSSEKGTVEGKVTRSDGTPLVGAKVLLSSIDGVESPQSARGRTNEDGQYTMGTIQKGDGVPAGKYAISVIEDRGAFDSNKPRTVAEKYEDAEASGFTIDVPKGGSTVFDMVLDPP